METYFRQQIDGLLITASWSHDLQAAAGIRAASQVFDDRPAWYIWPADNKGAYALAWAGPAEREGEDSPPAGSFALKFYPGPDNPDLAGFSPEERALAASELFDHTGTPVFEALTRIPEGMFTVAGLTLTLDPEGNWALITLEGQEELRQVADADQEAPFAVLGGAARFKAGQIMRRVPSWRLAWPMLDALACLLAFTRRQAPAGLTLASGTGFEIVSGGGGLTCRETSELNDLAFSLLLAVDCPHCRGRGLAQLDCELSAGGRADIVRLIPQPGFGPVGLSLSPLTPLNPAWWTLGQAEFKSHLSTACGCAGH